MLQLMGLPVSSSTPFAVTLVKGVLIVTLRSASVKGEPVPGWVLRQVQDRNLAKDLYENPQAAGLVSRLESIEVANGRIILVPRVRL